METVVLVQVTTMPVLRNFLRLGATFTTFPSWAVYPRDADEQLHDRRVPHVDLHHCRDIYNLRSRREKVRTFLRMSDFEFDHQSAYVDIECHHRKTILRRQNNLSTTLRMCMLSIITITS